MSGWHTIYPIFDSNIVPTLVRAEEVDNGGSLSGDM